MIPAQTGGGGTPKKKKEVRQTTEFEDWLSAQSYVAHVSFAFGGLEGRSLDQEPDTFANWIRDHLFLESLDLRGLGIDGQALLKLAVGLAGNRSISCLNFTHNNLGRKNIHGFLHALQDNVSIWRLELQKNHIDSDGAKAIADFMRENVGVTYLDLSNNPGIGPEGAQYLIDAFADNGSVYVMKLAGCNCGHDKLDLVGLKCRRNRAAVAYKMAQDPPAQEEKKEEEDSPGIEENEEEEEEEEVEEKATPPLAPSFEEEEDDDAEGGDEDGTAEGSKKKQKRAIGDVKIDGISAADLLPKETVFVLVDQKRREQERLDDASFFAFLAEYLDALEVDRAKFERDERVANENIQKDSAAFETREREHVQKIKDLESGIFEISKEMLLFRKQLEAKKQLEVLLKQKRYQLDVAMAAEEEEFVNKIEEQANELIEVEQEKKKYETQTNIVLKDLDMIKDENKRLRAHIRKFQEDIAEIVAT